MVVNDTQSVINDTINLSEWLPVINNTTNLSEGLPIINDTINLSKKLSVINNTTNLSEGFPVINDMSAKITCVVVLSINVWWPVWLLTCVAYDLCGCPLNQCLDDLYVNDLCGYPFNQHLMTYGHWPVWPMTYVVAGLCSLWLMRSLACVAYDLCGC